MSGTTTLDLQNVTDGDSIAYRIGDMYLNWSSLRDEWIEEKKELRNYIFATDTTTTANKKLNWKNSTTTPKLTQIRDNLHANYMAALFPRRQWLEWDFKEEVDGAEDKKESILSYMKYANEGGNTRQIVSDLIFDYIDYGNVFGTVEWVDERTIDEDTGEEIAGYVGPRIERISPFDIVFNPAAKTFKQSPKIIRKLVSLGELKREINKTGNKVAQEAFNRAVDLRNNFKAIDSADLDKAEGYRMDGFGSYTEYLNSDTIEILEFHGDLYDRENDKLYDNYIIKIIDRSYVLEKKQNPSWLANDNIFHVGWRKRPDNLYSMGPLDNLVGMQYRIDHLENLKADVFDLLAFPIVIITGEVEDFEYKPMEKIYTSEDGNVRFERPDAGALQADTQVALLERKMEEMAGAPREAMGIRTAGEKTAFEVQKLSNAASRIFQNKITHFEITFLEKALNGMLALARRKMNNSVTLKVIDDEFGGEDFRSITREDLAGIGSLRPLGASHFAEKATIIQNLTQMMATGITQDPAVSVHLSGKKVAKLMERLLDLEEYDIVRDNVRIDEQAETQRLTQQVQESLAVEGQTAGGITSSDEPVVDGDIGEDELV